MCSSQKSISSQQETQISSKNLPEGKQMQTSCQNQDYFSSNNLRVNTLDERAELIRSNKSILKRNLRNSLQIQKLFLPHNPKQENHTAASLKDLDSDEYIAFKRGTSECSDSTQGSQKMLISVEEMIVEQSFESKYELLKKIGQGAHSTVYKSIRKVDNKLYAFKKIKNVSFENQAKLKNLYKMVKLLDHSNIIKYDEYFFDSEKRTAFMVMQYCEYNDLRSEISKRSMIGKSFSHDQILSITKQVASVLKYLHAEGICHRDLKPQNILYSNQTGSIKVIDLDVCGVKKAKNQIFDLWTNTGTLLYRSPQSFQIGYSQKTDIWSLGAIIYELITEQVPFQTEYEKDFILKVKAEEVDFDRLKTSSKIKFCLIKCLQKDPKKRVSASELLNLLDSISKDDSSMIIREELLSQNSSKYVDDSQMSQICLGNILNFTY